MSNSEVRVVRLAYLVLVMTAIVVFDQWTKIVVDQKFYLGESVTVIKNFFNLTYVQNKGAAWGMGGNADTFVRHILFRYLPVGFCFFILYLIWQSISKELMLAWAYSLVLAGAVGNLIDRFRLDYVIDFLHFYYHDWHFPSFNIADSAITVGGALLIIDAIRKAKKTKKS